LALTLTPCFKHGKLLALVADGMTRMQSEIN
jgi:hypothetical protein